MEIRVNLNEAETKKAKKYKGKRTWKQVVLGEKKKMKCANRFCEYQYQSDNEENFDVTGLCWDCEKQIGDARMENYGGEDDA